MTELLRPGDVLLYSRDGLYSRLIRIKTWSTISHCEIFVGERERRGPCAVASRDALGVELYPLDLSDLDTVLRPVKPFDLDRAMKWFARVRGQGYDWIGLLAFFAAQLQGRDNRKQFCSEFATRFMRAGGIDPFNGYDADGISPGEFLKSPAFTRVPLGEPEAL